MIASLPLHIENLNKSLQTLDATGKNGFEGLVGEALFAITGMPFRLANSGYQRGVDGKAAFEGAVAFEGKLYTNDLPRKDVLSKIPDLVRHNDYADLVWVLGATCTVPSQLADDLRADGAKAGISVLILDWVPSDFPRLAVALAMGESKVDDFLKANLKSSLERDHVLAALAAIRTDAEFVRHAETVRRSLDASGMATAMAERANTDWFLETVSDKANARGELGQPLAPADTTFTVLDRAELISTLAPYLAKSSGEGVVCVHGEEGCGKTWIVMQCWLAQSHKSLLVFATPDDFSQVATQNDIEDLLIAKLIAQTGDVRSEESTIRWRRRLSAWKSAAEPSRPRLILVIDGINQRPNHAWGKTISNAATYVNRRGGRVIFTARTHYFETRVKKALSGSYKEITIPRWNINERDQILRQHNGPLNKLNPSVADFLRNPRILSIALEVFGDNIAAFEELSVDRLLFEHIMAGLRQDYGDDPVEFVARLRKHAKELLDRATARIRDDLYIFESEVPAVADGRFFHPIKGEPRKYELRDDGLTLALGLSIIESLRTAERNHRDLHDALKEIVEPIEALDRTAEAFIAAIAVTAADDDEFSPRIARALLNAFSELQNPPTHALSALVSFARARPLALAQTTRDQSLQGGHQPNFYWLQAALMEAAKSKDVWPQLHREVQQWLRAHSLAPEGRMYRHPRHDTQDRVDLERAERLAEIKEKLSALSPAEKKREGRLVETEGNLDTLWRLSLQLLAGKKLEPFADTLADWSFASALNGSYQVPTKEFIALIRLNRRDWSETRNALLRACEDLRPDTVSKTGKWALLRVCRATGDPNDDRAADVLCEQLTRDHPPRLGAGGVGETPEACDPARPAPADLGETIRRYRDLDVSTIRLDMGQTPQAHAFLKNRPIVARFAMDVAAAKHRELADDVAKRSGMPLRQGLLELREHSALLTTRQARALLARWDDAQAAGSSEGLSKDDNIMLQYELVIAFPFLPVNEQLQVLLATTEDQPLLLELINGAMVPDIETLDRFLEEARSSGAVYKQHLLLEIAAATGAELSSETVAFAGTLIASTDERLRTSAVNLAARSGNPDLLKTIAESNWESAPLEDKDSSESWYGSVALLKAAQMGLIDQIMVLDRISPRLYARAATMLENTAVLEIARRIDASIRRAAGLPDELIAPDIEIEAEGGDSDEPAHFVVSESRRAAQNMEEAFRRLSESNDEFRARQDRNYDAFHAFRDELTTAKAYIILDQLTHAEFATIVAAHPTIAERWYDLFIDLNESKLPAVHNLILLLASALADVDPDRSAALFERTAHSRPLVRFTFGKSGIDLDSLSAWKGGNALPLDALRKKRLDTAATDQAIAVEVFSALQNGHRAFLEAYVDEKLLQPEPAEIARGLMVVGFSDQSARNDRILENFKVTAGLPGKAHAAAIAAYWCNGWARHWFKVMCDTEDPVAFWQAAVLFAECVDGRFQTWRNNFSELGRPISAFGASRNNSLTVRYEKLGKAREKRLFGQEAPPAIFVISAAAT
ncbi:hypothetical protein [Rhizobium hidalgonense]|uniref:hypothetical protein n=1 Tax=Rhizobium hidalgonense TaxID=1538159 RepID=UPI002871C901|nr:hypothetical protein [Rhizobium hidalgonense]MDR9812122.1 hypothetical protein [Rhizobium hidalgonense]